MESVGTIKGIVKFDNWSVMPVEGVEFEFEIPE